MIHRYFEKIIGCIPVIIFLLFLSSCRNAPVTQIQDAHKADYPVTEEIQYAGYSRIIYVSRKGSDSSGNGTKGSPFRSIPFALQQIPNMSVGEKAALLVGKGEYSDQTLHLRRNVDIFGGFDDTSWDRHIYDYPTTLSGDEERRIIVAADSCTIDGFLITDGRIRGKGAALICNGTSPVISNNVFSGNRTLCPEKWNPKYIHETAHDGGAIYGFNGAGPVIRNNLFVNNKTENGRGGAIAFDGWCKPVITHNVFLSNMTGLVDAMRSSDGGAVSIFNWCDAEIDGNVFLGNRAESKNDGGALFIALWSSAKVVDNLFVDSQAGDDAGALFVGGQEHRYDAPLDPLPPADKFFVCIRDNVFIGNSNPSRNSGAMRFTMESRGEFLNNLVAFNNGIYFQRSETRIAGNIILDDFLIIETKEGLGVSTIEDNIIWADIQNDEVPVVFRNNVVRGGMKVETGAMDAPEFIHDGLHLQAAGMVYQPQKFQTHIFLHAMRLRPGSLVNRVFRSGAKWSVVKSNTESDITVWGDVSDDYMFTILPTYTRKIN